MIENISIKITKKFIDNRLILPEEREEYIYALICNIETIISIGSVLIIALILHNFVPTLFFLLTFLNIRKRSGGYHFDSFRMCYISTLCIYLEVVLIVKYYYMYIQFFTILTVVFSMFTFFIGVVNHPNIDYSNEELVAAKESTRLVIVLIDICSLVFLYIHLSKVILLFWEMGVILSSILLILSKYIKKK